MILSREFFLSSFRQAVQKKSLLLHSIQSPTHWYLSATLTALKAHFLEFSDGDFSENESII